MSDEKEGEDLHQIQFNEQQNDKIRSQIPVCDFDNTDQTQSLQKPMQFSQQLYQKTQSLSQPYQKSLSQQTYKKSLSQQSHSKQYPQQQPQLPLQSQNKVFSSISSPALHRRRTKKQMKKLRNLSLEFQEKEVRQFYVSLFEQLPAGIFNVIMSVKVLIVSCFIICEAWFFRNTIATILSAIACGLLIALWSIGVKQNKLLPTIFRISHVLLSVIMYLVIMQLTKHQNTYDNSITALTSASKNSLTAFSSIVFTLYQAAGMQLEVKWFFKGILFFVIILLNMIILLESDLFSFCYGLIAFILLGILLYHHEIAKKERAFKLFRIAEDLDSLKALINDILPMQIFIVQRCQPIHSSVSSPSISWISSLFKSQKDKQSMKNQCENVQTPDQSQQQLKTNQQHQRIETECPLIGQTFKGEEDKKATNKVLQITFANKLTYQDFGNSESSDILQQLSNIHLPKLNNLHNLTLKTAKNEQSKKPPENLLELLSTKLNKPTQEKPQDFCQNIQTSLPVLPSSNAEEAAKQKQEQEQQQQQINKSLFTFNSPSKLLEQQVSPLYQKTTDAYQISSEKLATLHNKELKNISDTSPRVFSPRAPVSQLPYFPTNNMPPQETETPKNSKNNSQNIHSSTFQPVIQVHPPSQHSTFCIPNQSQSLKQSELSQVNYNIQSATTPQFSKPRQSTQNNEQSTGMNQFKYKDSLQNNYLPPNNLKLVDEYLNCKHKQYENDLEEKNYDIRLVECRWEGQKSIMVIMNNIDERLMRQRLLQIEQYKDSVIDTISHNLKTPLNCILAPLECVKTQLESQIKNEKSEDVKGEFTAESLRHIGMAINNCQLLLYMINDLIDYSQIIKGDFSFRLDFTAFKLSSVVKALRMLFEDQMKSKKIEFVITSKVPLSEIVLFHDERRLLQILVNLISNSLKYTLKGKIELIIEYPKDELASFFPNPQTAVSSPVNYSKPKQNLKKYQFKAENLLRFVLIDSGIGMSAQNLYRLKDILFKKKHADNNNSKSSGLGLSMCFALIEQVGYQRIYPEIQSQENFGTRFSFTIEQICQPSNNKPGQVYQTLQQALEKQFMPSGSSNSIVGTASPVCQEYQSLNAIGSKHNSFELPTIQQTQQQPQLYQHPSVILSQYNFSNLKTKSSLDNPFKNQSSTENSNSLLSKQLIKEVSGNSETQHQTNILSKIDQKEEHILESSGSEEEEEKEEEKIQSNTQQQQYPKQNQYLGIYPDYYSKSRQPSFSSSINKEKNSFLQIEQSGYNYFNNPTTDKYIPPSRKNSQNKKFVKLVFPQQQPQPLGLSPSALSNGSKDHASFYSSIAQRHNILFGKEIKNNKNEEYEEENIAQCYESAIEQPREILSNKAPPSSPSMHEIDRSYGNSCDCIQEETAERQDEKEKGISGLIEIRKKVFQTFGNSDYLNVESEFMQRSQEDYINPETVSEDKSHITTQKYNIVPSASKGNSYPAHQKTSPQISSNDNLRWMLPHLQTEQNIDETIEMILTRKHILIVDDTVYNIMMMKILMRNVKDLRIEEAYNGKDALKKFQEYAMRNIFFDFIFMDIEMPVMNGLECIQNIRQFENINHLQPTAIISVTAYEKNLQEVRQAGADELIAKPIRKDKFLQTLRHLTSDNPPPLPTHSSNILLQL